MAPTEGKLNTVKMDDYKKQVFCCPQKLGGDFLWIGK